MLLFGFVNGSKVIIRTPAERIGIKFHVKALKTHEETRNQKHVQEIRVKNWINLSRIHYNFYEQP